MPTERPGVEPKKIVPLEFEQPLSLLAQQIEALEKQLADTYFAWIGETKDDSVYYYRVHSPVVLIEFDHETPVGLRGRYPAGVPYREHIHAIVRTPNGNDYGKDLLRLHYQQHPH